MSIKKQSDTAWRLDVRLWVNSKEYRHRETFNGGLKAAKIREHEIKQQLKAKADSESGSLKIKTFGEALTFYSDNKELGTSQSLIDRLQKDLGHVLIEELFSGFMLWHKEVRKTVSVGTANRFIAWSKAALNYCVKNKLIENNPIVSIELKKEFPRKQRLTAEQENKLLEVIQREAPHIYPIVQYALLVPCRKGELVAMKREWFDMVNNCIRIPEGVTKNDDACIKPIPPEMVEYFRNVPIESPFLFYRIDRSGKYVSVGDFKRSFKRCLGIAEIEDFRFHDTRRTSYTSMILNGNHSKVVQRISGHRTDMSKVYLSIEAEEAAKVVKFRPPEPKTGHQTGHSAQVNE